MRLCSSALTSGLVFLSLLIGGFMTARAQQGSKTFDPPPNWPSCESGQIQVMLAGMYHMANPGLDAIERDIDDVLSPRRQAEIRDVVDRLARFTPDKVATETDFEIFSALNERYRSYLDGAHELRRSETDQLGFRLAQRLGHDSIYAADFPIRSLGNDSIGAFYDRHPEVQDANRPIWAAGERRAARDDSLLRSTMIGQYLSWINSEAALRTEPNKGMFAHIVAGEGHNYGGAELLLRWYERNIRIGHHLARIATSEDERILFLVGAGHVTVLRHILDEAPQFCPVSPLPYLQ